MTILDEVFLFWWGGHPVFWWRSGNTALFLS